MVGEGKKKIKIKLKRNRKGRKYIKVKNRRYYLDRVKTKAKLTDKQLIHYVLKKLLNKGRRTAAKKTNDSKAKKMVGPQTNGIAFATSSALQKQRTDLEVEYKRVENRLKEEIKKKTDELNKVKQIEGPKPEREDSGLEKQIKELRIDLQRLAQEKSQAEYRVREEHDKVEDLHGKVEKAKQRIQGDIKKLEGHIDDFRENLELSRQLKLNNAISKFYREEGITPRDLSNKLKKEGKPQPQPKAGTNLRVELLKAANKYGKIEKEVDKELHAESAELAGQMAALLRELDEVEPKSKAKSQSQPIPTPSPHKHSHEKESKEQEGTGASPAELSALNNEITKNLKGSGKKRILGDMLYSDQIDNVMSIFPDFEGAIPRDGMNEIIGKIKPHSRGSFIINTDSKKGPGQHWQAVYYDGRPNGSNSIEFFDSYGDEMPADMLGNLKELSDKLHTGKPLTVKVNRIKQQRANSFTCGWQCIKFLKDRYEGKPFKETTGFNDINNGEKAVQKLKKKFNHFQTLETHLKRK